MKIDSNFLSQINLSKVIFLFLKNNKETNKQALSANATHTAVFLFSSHQLGMSIKVVFGAEFVEFNWTVPVRLRHWIIMW